MRLILTLITACVMISCAMGQEIKAGQALSTSTVSTEPNLLAQIIVDALRVQTKADAAFLAAGFFADAKIDEGTTSIDAVIKALQYPDDEVVILTLKGDQIKAAFERALGLAPQRNSAYLQVSGFHVEYDPNGAADSRITLVSIDNKAVVNTKEYKIATTAPFGRGALGYFKVWDKSQITKKMGEVIDNMVKAYLTGKTSLPIDAKPRIVSKE